MTVYVDESGNGGLFDAEQPVFTLSAIAIEEEEARRLREEYLPQKLIGEGELKHDSLSKRLRNGVQKRLGDLQEVMLRDHLAFSYVFDKRFFIIEKMMMDCRAGCDIRAGAFQRDAMLLYYRYAEINTYCNFYDVLRAYVRVIGLNREDENFHTEFDRFVSVVNVAISQWPILGYFLGGIASRHPDCVEEFELSKGRCLHAPMLVGLVNEIYRKDQRDINIICDDSPQYDDIENLFCQTPLSGHVHSLINGGSDKYCGIQLADLLAGGGRYVGELKLLGKERSEKEKDYVARLKDAYERYDRLLRQPPDVPVSQSERMAEIRKWSCK